MNKLSKTILGLLILSMALVITFRAIDQEPTNNLLPDAKVVAIFDNSGCVVCHSQNPRLPFYSDWPMLGGKIKRDAANAYKSIDLEPSFEAIKTGEVADPVILKRVGSVVADHSMPPLSYTILRPGSAISTKERDILKEWLSRHMESKNNFY